MKKNFFIILIFILFFTGCNFPISNCVKGYHEFDDGKIKEETSDFTIEKYKCKNCFESYEVKFYQNRIYFEDLWIYSFVDNLKVYSSVKYNENAYLNEYQTNYFNDLLEIMRRCELNYMNEMCNCTPLVEIILNDGGDSYVAFSFHSDHLVLETKRRGNDFWYVIQDSLDFKIDMFNEIYKWINVEANKINSEYDYISKDDLKYLSKNCKAMNFNLGFEELISKDGRILQSSSSLKQFNEVALNYYNPEFYQDIEIVNIIETEYYYCAITNYLYTGNDKQEQRYLISFKSEVFDFDNSEMYIRDKVVIKLILDTLLYYRFNEVVGCSGIYSEIIEEQDYYMYVKYEVQTSFTDNFNNMKRISCADYIRTIYRINKDTSSIVKVSSQKINAVSFD